MIICSEAENSFDLSIFKRHPKCFREKRIGSDLDFYLAAAKCMLQKILKSSGLDAKKAAELLGINARIFDEWVSNQKPIPPSYVPLLATVLGIDPNQLDPFSPERTTASEADVAPAIWYRFRGPNLVNADRECVFLIRQFAHNFNQLEDVTKSHTVGWECLFPSIRAKIDREAPPREQGRQAARLFRASRGLDQGRRGIGDVIRGNLRSMGMVVIESPMPESRLEGCTFFVRTGSNNRPCIYANTHHLTWFRRNEVLMHETGHGIFDAESSGGSLDFADTWQEEDLQEERSQAFAQEALVPADVIRHIAQAHGMTWTKLSNHDLTVLVSETDVELRTLLRAACDAELISRDRMDEYNQADIATDLKSVTDHALSAGEYIQKIGITQAEKWTGKRETNIASRTLRLPVPYIDLVIEAFKDGLISRGKSAELLMIDEDTFDSRFQDAVRTVEEM